MQCAETKQAQMLREFQRKETFKK